MVRFEDALEDGGPAPKRQSTKQLFSKELTLMMYGFGDVERPKAQTVAVVQDLVCDFLTTLSRKAVQNCVQSGGLRKGVFKVSAVLCFVGLT